MMKKVVVLALAFFVLASNGFCDNKKFHIDGTITYNEGGKIYLLVFDGHRPDTLASSTIKNNAFQLEGVVREMKVAQLWTQGQSIGDIFLENEHYTISSQSGLQIKGGGAAQQLANKFSEATTMVFKNFADHNKIYAEAQQSKNLPLVKTYDELIASMIEIVKLEHNVLIALHPDDFVSAYIVHQSTAKMGYNDVKKRYDLLSEKGKATVPGKAIGEWIKGTDRVRVGETAPDFTLTTPDGGKISLYQLKGKLKLIDFWASWCAPCRAENPNVVAVYNDYHQKGLEIISVSFDTNKKDWVNAIEKDGMIWKHGCDFKEWDSSELKKMYMVPWVPYTVLLDENNRIIANSLSGDALRKKVSELLDK